jgi:FkbM family methyltransferase
VADARWLRARRSERLYRLVDQLVPPQSIALDIGASVGFFSARLLRLVGRRGRVHAFEPNPNGQESLARFRTSRLQVHPVALSDSAGTASLRVPVFAGVPEFGMGSLERPGGKRDWSYREIEVPVRRLADEVSPSPRLRFIKCDVEGHEDAVLAGAQEVIAASMPAVLIEVEQRHRSRPVGEAFEFFRRLGYEGWALYADGPRPLSQFDVERDQLRYLPAMDVGRGHRDYVHNFLFLRPGERLPQ